MTKPVSGPCRLRRMLEWTRLLWACACLALAFLTAFPAPSQLLWMVAIVLIGGAHWLVLAAAVVLLPGWRKTIRGRLAVGISMVAAVVVMLPAFHAQVSAGAFARSLDVQLNGTDGAAEVLPAALMGSSAGRGSPFVFADMFLHRGPELVETTTHEYARPEGKSLSFDLYLPSAHLKPPPVILEVHGGAWRMGTNRDIPEFNHQLAAIGYAVVSINYRLAPKWKFPAPIEDIASALDYVIEHADELGVDATKIVLVGRSAGAHLVLLASYTLDRPEIAGVAALYPPTDLGVGYERDVDHSTLDIQKILFEFIGGSPTSVPEAYHAVSPLLHVDSSSPPTLLMHGTKDEIVPVWHSRELANRLKAQGVLHAWVEVPWGHHMFDGILTGPGGQLLTYSMEQFLARVMIDDGGL
jgi:acetyl esterase/lipase